MMVRARVARHRAAVVGAVAVLLAATACSGADCAFDDCPDVPAAEAGRLTGTDPSGAVRWTTTVADLLSEPPVVSNGHVLVVGCHATHVVDVASGAVSTPSDLVQVIGVVQRYAVGTPAEGDAIVAAERLDGAVGGWSWQGSPPDEDADLGYRSSAVVTRGGIVGVRGQSLVAWSPGSDSWDSVEVPLPVGAWRLQRLVAADETHVVVPGSDGSVLGVDLGSRSVTWRSLPTRPAAPADVSVRRVGRDVQVEVWYPRTTVAAITGEAVWDTERWSLDARTGAARSPRTTSTGPRSTTRRAPSPTVLHDPSTGWTVTLGLRERPRGGCF
ncbi:hypothetical protein [Terrabacter sp. Ter38]|uniref:hypothetical protein n=1 Tax=Terrabacter sp. Ter38 TaxID=2926030 RepID=UPI00211730BB|nr:hypothetical protein [Terrabacter sp. Ter38]